MTDEVTITIDGESIKVPANQPLIATVAKLGHYIPTLCDYKDLMPAGTCRICTVKANGKFQTACMLITSEGLEVENSSDEVLDLRKSILEMMFVEGNHICPVCEKSGNCDLQSIGYRYQLTVHKFPHLYPKRKLDASAPNLMVEYNRCIQCRRCIRGIRDEDDNAFFFFENRGYNVKLVIDPSMFDKLTPQIANAAAKICPVGALMKKEPGYQIPIGKRHYDKPPKLKSEEKTHE